jgi:chemotaxis protein MotB
MSSNNDPHAETPVIRIVKKGGHAGHHGGAWKVAYADFVTAMMALFIVLWILGQGESVQKSVASYFRNPTGKTLIGPGPGPNSKATAMTMRQERGVDPSMVNLKDDPLKALEEEADQLRQSIQQKPDLKQLDDQINIEVTPEGVRVEINESERVPLFESGSAQLSPKLKDALRALAAEYAKLPNKLVIEGHTDSAPYAPGSAMSNWELATLRANEARHVLMDNGLPEFQIYMVRGFADRKPRFANAADPRNRRISMLLLSVEGLRIASGMSTNLNNGAPSETGGGADGMKP